VGSKVGPQLGLLQPDVPAADDDHRAGQVLLLHCRGGGQERDLIQAGQVRDVRRGAGRDYVGGGAQPFAVDLERLPVNEPGVAVTDREAVRVGDVGVLRLPHPDDEVLLLRHQRRHVHPVRAGRRHREAVGQRAVPLAGGGEQVLARDATDVQTRPAQGAVLE